jgi:hypothetical protein
MSKHITTLILTLTHDRDRETDAEPDRNRDRDMKTDGKQRQEGHRSAETLYLFNNANL